MYDGTFMFWSHFIFGFIKGDQGGSKGIKMDQRQIKEDQDRSRWIKVYQRGSRQIKEDQGRSSKYRSTTPPPTSR